MVLVEGVVFIEEYVLVFGRSIRDMDGMPPGPHSAASKAHADYGVKMLKRYCDFEPCEIWGGCQCEVAISREV